MPLVYPRVCGGSGAIKVILPPQQGLSPRVRRKHFAGVMRPLVSGSIPACAGEAEAEAAKWRK